MTETDTIPLSAVRIDGGTQSRVELNEATIAEYTEVIRSGGDLPPVVTFFDGVNFWLADGFHRFFAHKAADSAEIPSEMHDGTCRDAVLYSLSANAAHGLRRTNEDKRKAVLTMLNDSEWATWTQEKIAKTCGVSREFVSRLSSKQDHLVIGSQDTTKIVERNGKTYEQNTANIGKKPTKASDTTPTKDVRVQDEALSPSPKGASETLLPSSIAAPCADPELNQVPESFGPSEEEIASALQSQVEEIEALRKIAASDDVVAAALAEATQLRALNYVLKSQNAGYQTTIAEQIRTIKSLRAKVSKLEKSA